jgi:hypothetical protein
MADTIAVPKGLRADIIQILVIIKAMIRKVYEADLMPCPKCGGR